MVGQAVFDPNVEQPTFKDPDQISRAQRYYIVKHATAIRSWLATLYVASLQAAIDGDPDPGSKAVEGDQGNRFFRKPDEAEALLVEALGDEAYKPKQLIGITEIKKKVKPGRKKIGHPETWDALTALLDRPEGRPKLVAADHPKPAYVAHDKYADEFDDLD